MKSVTDLESLGFALDFDADGAILFSHRGPRPDPATVRGLLDDLRARKAEALAFLRARAGDDDSNRFARDPDPPDPRPDLVHDAAAWRRLLCLAWPIDGDDPRGLYGALLGLRCCGAGLVHDGGRWRLTAGQMAEDDYNRDRASWLRPHHKILVTLLDELSRGGPIEEN